MSLLKIALNASKIQTNSKLPLIEVAVSTDGLSPQRGTQTTRQASQNFRQTILFTTPV